MPYPCTESFNLLDSGVPVATFPEEKALWDTRAAFLIRDYDGTYGKLANKTLQELLNFANGDSSGTVITHWCLLSDSSGRPCCQSDQDALCRFLALAVPFFSKGYPVPLLYRMKHYKPASSFVKIGCMFFNLLPRVLAEMHLHQQQPETDLARCVDAFMSETTGRPSSREEFENLLAEALDTDRSYAVQNGVRRLVAQEISKPIFCQAALLVDCLIQPLEHGINFLLGHTKMLADLKYVGRGHKDSKDLQDKCCAGFLHLVTGELANKLLKSYMALLDTGLRELVDMGFCPSGDQLNVVFSSIAVLCTDLHRRLKLDFCMTPFRLFPMISMDAQQFMQAWNGLEMQRRSCEACLDEEFTLPLLRQFAGLASRPVAEQESARKEIQALLTDIATWSPLTSDMVELKNGQVQFAVSKRGAQSVKGPIAAAEVSLIQAAVLQHEWIKGVAAEETLPKKSVSSGVRKMSRVKSTKANDAQFHILWVSYP